MQTIIGYFYCNDTCMEWEEIKDSADIVELWHLNQVKCVLE